MKTLVVNGYYFVVKHFYLYICTHRNEKSHHIKDTPISIL
ncbi:hypothetical protein SAMN04488513_101425 [Pseudozobellia thermophila]|uniref:Uncharacterized protein n=1 Tax=Pseudozobellia thermophila TaxID=192903 RepID=A0A1M6BHV4_9FLAO|nr:hypothetical protein SAMN04488513_101425 [Pseudozobellia thermophila]